MNDSTSLVCKNLCECSKLLINYSTVHHISLFVISISTFDLSQYELQNNLRDKILAVVVESRAYQVAGDEEASMA